MGERDVLQEENYRDCVIQIERDEFAENPREWEELTKMVCWHSQYNLGDKHDFGNPKEFLDWAKAKKIPYKPLYLYNHSGLTIRTTPFSCRWDSGQVGFIYIERETFRKQMGVKRVNLKLMSKIMLQDVELYDQYLRGDIYQFTITHEKINTFQDVGGFYGWDHITSGLIPEAQREIDGEMDRFLEQEAMNSLISGIIY